MAASEGLGGSFDDGVEGWRREEGDGSKPLMDREGRARWRVRWMY